MQFSLATELPRRREAPSILESQSCVSGAFGDCFDAPVIDEAAPVKYDGIDARRFRALPNNLADSARLGTLCCVRASPIDHVLLQITGGY